MSDDPPNTPAQPATSSVQTFSSTASGLQSPHRQETAPDAFNPYFFWVSAALQGIRCPPIRTVLPTAGSLQAPDTLETVPGDAHILVRGRHSAHTSARVFGGALATDPENQIHCPNKHTDLDIGRAKATAQNSLVVVTNFFAATAAQILGVIRSDHALNDATKFQLKLLNLTSYAAILLNVMATIVSVLLIHALNEINASKQTIAGAARSGVLQHPNVKWVFFQWIVLGSLGMIFMIIQTLAYVWLREGLSMGIPVTVVTASVTLVLTVVWLSRGHPARTSKSPSDFFGSKWRSGGAA
ncbi:hypothetical protein B0H14DRAFT_2727847 [Mycena olivaceomarginata]|nr:hypothetical protein B0H14DRAFT_2727847 [Mycena olivaceomarginata]